MDHVKAFLFKFVATITVLFIILTLIYSVPFRYVFYIALLLSVLSYVVGDLFILRKTNNATATFADFLVTFSVISFMTSNISHPVSELFANHIFGLTFMSTIMITVFEYFFHKFMYFAVFDEGEATFSPLQYQTEVAEEIAPNVDKESDE